MLKTLRATGETAMVSAEEAVNPFDYRPAASSGSQQSLTLLGTNDNEITLFPLAALALSNAGRHVLPAKELWMR